MAVVDHVGVLQMDFKFLLALSILAAAVSLSAALRCYACAGSGASDCARGRKSSMVIQPCANTTHFGHAFRNKTNHDEADENDSEDAKLQPFCFQFSVTSYQPKLFARGCGLVPVAADACEFIQKYIHIQGCKACKTDLCNNRHQQRVQNDSWMNNTVQ